MELQVGPSFEDSCRLGLDVVSFPETDFVATTAAGHAGTDRFVFGLTAHRVRRLRDRSAPRPAGATHPILEP